MNTRRQLPIDRARLARKEKEAAMPPRAGEREQARGRRGAAGARRRARFTRGCRAQPSQRGPDDLQTGRGTIEALDRMLSADPPVTRDHLRAELIELRVELRAEIRGLRAEMIKRQRELVWKMAGLLMVQAGAIVALVKLLP
jgi:hypothetical protein